MIDPQLSQYVAQSRASGKNDEQIRTELVAAGWNEQMISESLSFSPQQSQQPGTHSKLIIGLGIAFFVVGGGAFAGYYGYTHWMQPSPEPSRQENVSDTNAMDSKNSNTNVSSVTLATYTNEEFGYQFKHPTSWTIDTKPTEYINSSFAILPGLSYSPSGRASGTGEAAEDGSIGVIVQWRRVSPTESLEQWFKREALFTDEDKQGMVLIFSTPTSTLSAEQITSTYSVITVSGNSAVVQRVRVASPTTNSLALNKTEFYIQKNDVLISMAAFSPVGGHSEEVLNTFEEVIQTFQFTGIKQKDTPNTSTLISNCEKDEYGLYKVSCIAKIAQEQNDVKVCDNAQRSTSRQACYEMFAEFKKDPLLCNNIPYPEDRGWIDRCYWNIGKINRNASLCEKIESPENKEQCYLEIAIAIPDPSLCQYVKEPFSHDVCLEKTGAN